MARRLRTVPGSCWPCKQRRVKCDTQKPACGRCLDAGALCNYGKLLVRWKAPTDPRMATNAMSAPSMSIKDPYEPWLAVSQRRALEYFQVCAWPLLFTSSEPCQPPIDLALNSRPVLLTMCVFADAHRWPIPRSDETALLQQTRVKCLSAVRQDVRQYLDLTTAPNPSTDDLFASLVLAVLLLYFLDGYLDCTEQSALINCHRAGVKAVLEHMGRLNAILSGATIDQNMLLSEFASTDLTYAMLHGQSPSLPVKIWAQLDKGPVWWEKPRYATTSLASTMAIMAEMAFYRDAVRNQRDELSLDKVQDFEARLQIQFPPLSETDLLDPELGEIPETETGPAMNADALCRAFQHAALIYLYRAICYLPPRHGRVQAHVHACLECIQGMTDQAKAQKCAVFPLYVAGAHTFLNDHRCLVLERLESIHSVLRFQTVASVSSALEALWGSERQTGTWFDMFAELNPSALVL